MRPRSRLRKGKTPVKTVLQYVEDEMARIVATDPRINFHRSRAAARDASVRFRRDIDHRVVLQ